MKKPITPGQFEQLVRVAKDAGEPTMVTALGQMRDDSEITSDGAQQVLTKGDLMRRKLVVAWKTIISDLAEEAKPLLRLLSGGKRVVIPACDGKRNFVAAKAIFTWGFDSDFVNYGLDVPSEPTPETPVEVHEMIEDGNWKQILDSTGEPIETLFFTQAQALGFVETNPSWLRQDGYATFIPFKEKVCNTATGEEEMEFFVAYVRVDSVNGLSAHVYRFGRDYVWHARDRHRFVLPKLAA